LEADHFGSTSRRRSSYLFLLPLELRSLIYLYVLGGRVWVIGVSGIKPPADNGTTNALALLQANVQTHSEACLIPYKHNTFQGRHDGHLKTWVDTLSSAQRAALTSIKRHQRSYILQGTQGLEVSPIFWMEIPDMSTWGLTGLRRIEIEIVLTRWSCGSDREKVNEVKDRALEKLRALIQHHHPGVRLRFS